MNREFLQLARTFDPDADFVAAKMVSEKLDGQRFFWDGGYTRGLPISQVPWANTEKSNAVPYSTGLWSRYGNPLNAPDYWLNELPNFFLDGELWLGYGRFQELMEITRANVNVKEEAWGQVKAYVFDTPHPTQIFMDGKINNINYRKIFRGFCKSDMPAPIGSDTPFRSRYRWLQNNLPITEFCTLLEQEMLPFTLDEARERLQEMYHAVLDKGGEGLIIKAPNDLWFPKRVPSVLKAKPWHDAEAEVIGYMWGAETDKGSKLLGLMGSVIAKSEFGIFKISGFRESERIMYRDGVPIRYIDAPGQEIQDDIENPLFRRGEIITYKYLALTEKEGLPKDAQFWRKNPELH